MSATEQLQPSDLRLADVWAKAESIGQVSVSNSITGYRYKVIISYNRRSGTHIEAAGFDNDIGTALRRALAEACAFRD